MSKRLDHEVAAGVSSSEFNVLRHLLRKSHALPCAAHEERFRFSNLISLECERLVAVGFSQAVINQVLHDRFSA